MALAPADVVALAHTHEVVAKAGFGQSEIESQVRAGAFGAR